MWLGMYKYRQKNFVQGKLKRCLADCNRLSYPFDIGHRQSPPHISASLVFHTLSLSLLVRVT